MHSVVWSRGRACCVGHMYMSLSGPRDIYACCCLVQGTWAFCCLVQEICVHAVVVWSKGHVHSVVWPKGHMYMLFNLGGEMKCIHLVHLFSSVLYLNYIVHPNKTFNDSVMLSMRLSLI